MNSIIQKIIENKENVLITGSNGVGKSFLASEIMKLDLQLKFYYIGVVNQSFKLRGVPVNDYYEYNIINENRFSIKSEENAIFYDVNAYDTYGKYDAKSVAILMGKKFFELLKTPSLKTEIIKALEEFGIKISTDSITIENVSFKENDRKDISAGYQAILRVFTELFSLKDRYKDSFLIFLDEVSKSLDSYNSGILLNVFKRYFPEYQFIITTHSYDLILGAEDYKIIKINNDKVIHYFESNDFKNIEDIRTRIFEISSSGEIIDKKEKIIYELGNLIDNLRKDITEENIERLNSFLKDTEKNAEESNKIKIMWNYAKKILSEKKIVFEIGKKQC